MSTPELHPIASKPENWFRPPIDELLASLNSSKDGLTVEEAVVRLEGQGPNALKASRIINPVRIFLGQFKSLIIWVLIAAGIVSALLGEGIDAIAILAIVVLNAAIGFFQEFKAEKSLDALKQSGAPLAKVWRDGQLSSVPATEVVTGDLLGLEAGDLVAADARLLESASLACNESALTGESEAVRKQVVVLDVAELALADRENMVFMGTSVATGTGRALVVATAMQTELGRIAALLEETAAEPKTPLQKKLDAFGVVLVWASLGIIALLFGLGLLRGTRPFELFMTSVSLAVAVVPEGLPAIVTVALALGVVRMSRRRALVRKLPAVETLGSTTVICTDKTGTLTRGEMTVRSLCVADQSYDVGGEGYGPGGEVRLEGKPIEQKHEGPLQDLAMILVTCNNAHLVEEKGSWRVIGDPSEGALLAVAGKLLGSQEGSGSGSPRYAEIPFDSQRKRSTVIEERQDGRLRASSNGAPGILLALCSGFTSSTGVQVMTEADRQRILEQTSRMAQQGLRVLASAYRDLDRVNAESLTSDLVERDLVFVGLSGMQDPPRPEAKEAVATCRAAGIRVVMITGDHPQTALAIARDIGIAEAKDGVLSGIELDKLNDEKLRERVLAINVFARVTAEHKLRIIRAWKANGAVVAMTGDGVNDAPAIQGADIGIAMGGAGTEVTKQAADLIITDDNFASIVAAVEEGRGIYDNIRKTLQYLLAGNVGELSLMTICLLVGLPAPLLPVQLLWINLVTDGLPALCLATDPIDPEVMNRPPRGQGERIMDRSFLWTMLLTGFLTATVAFAVYIYFLKFSGPGMARSAAFSVLVFAELLRAFGGRSETKPIWRIPFFTNVNLAVVVCISFALQIWAMHSGILGRFLKMSVLPLQDCLWLLAIGCIPLLTLELVKLVRNKRAGGMRS